MRCLKLQAGLWSRAASRWRPPYMSVSPTGGLELTSASPSQKPILIETTMITLSPFPIFAKRKGSRKEWYIPARAKLIITDKRLKKRICAWEPKIHEALSIYFSRHPAIPSLKKPRKVSAKAEASLKSSIEKVTGGKWLKEIQVEYGKLDSHGIPTETFCHNAKRS